MAAGPWGRGPQAAAGGGAGAGGRRGPGAPRGPSGAAVAGRSAGRAGCELGSRALWQPCGEAGRRKAGEVDVGMRGSRLVLQELAEHEELGGVKKRVLAQGWERVPHGQHRSGAGNLAARAAGQAPSTHGPGRRPPGAGGAAGAWARGGKGEVLTRAAGRRA